MAAALVVGGLGDQLLRRGLALESASALVLALVVAPLVFLFAGLGAYVSTVVARLADAPQAIAFSLVMLTCYGGSVAAEATEASIVPAISVPILISAGSASGDWLRRWQLHREKHTDSPAS